MTTIKVQWEIEVDQSLFGGSATTSEDTAPTDGSIPATMMKGSGRSFNSADKSLFVSVESKSGYLQLSKDPVRLVRCDSQRNSPASCDLFAALMIQQELGWPEDNSNAAVEDGEGNNNIEGEANGGAEALERLEPGQLVRAMLRPGGHFYNGRITSCTEDGSTYGILFFDGDEVDALPRNLIHPIDSQKKMKKTPAVEKKVIQQNKEIKKNVVQKKIVFKEEKVQQRKPLNERLQQPTISNKKTTISKSKKTKHHTNKHSKSDRKSKKSSKNKRNRMQGMSNIFSNFQKISPYLHSNLFNFFTISIFFIIQNYFFYSHQVFITLEIKNLLLIRSNR